MAQCSPAEKIMVEEITQCGADFRSSCRGLSVGKLVRAVRCQLGLTQQALAKRAKVPQSTISRLEQGNNEVSLATLTKVLEAMNCDLALGPVLREPIEVIRIRQAKKVAQKHIRYLAGTMSLEEQEPDPRFLNELVKQEEQRLLLGPGSRLWVD